MALFNVEKAVWKDKYALGNATVDGQHKGLFKTFNSLVDAISANGEVKSKAQKMLVTLVDYMQAHFSDEEELWKKDGEIYENHRKVHYTFVQMVMESTKKDLKNENFTPDLFVFIRDWLVDHIIKMDHEDYKRIKEKE